MADSGPARLAPFPRHRFEAVERFGDGDFCVDWTPRATGLRSSARVHRPWRPTTAHVFTHLFEARLRATTSQCMSGRRAPPAGVRDLRPPEPTVGCRRWGAADAIAAASVSLPALHVHGRADVEPTQPGNRSSLITQVPDTLPVRCGRLCHEYDGRFRAAAGAVGRTAAESMASGVRDQRSQAH